MMVSKIDRELKKKNGKSMPLVDFFRKKQRDTV